MIRQALSLENVISYLSVLNSFYQNINIGPNRGNTILAILAKDRNGQIAWF